MQPFNKDVIQTFFVGILIESSHFSLFKMFTRLSCIYRTSSISLRLIHRTAWLKNIEQPVEQENKKRTKHSPSEFAELVLRRLDFRQQRGLVKALIIGSGTIAVSAVIFLYIFRKPLKNQTVVQVADVAKSSLEQGPIDKIFFIFVFIDRFLLESVRAQVTILTQELIENLLSNRTILVKTLAFFEQILDDPSTKQSLIRLLQSLMVDVEMQRYVSEFVSRIVYDVMKKPETELELGQLIRRALLQKDNQDALYILLKQFIDDEKTKKLINQLAFDVVEKVLNDENVKITATNFVKDVLADPTLQERSADFAWKTAKTALKPKWFSTSA